MPQLSPSSLVRPEAGSPGPVERSEGIARAAHPPLKPVLLKELRLVSIVCSCLVVLTGGSSFLGWIMGAERLVAYSPGWIVIKPNAAIAALLAGLSLLLLCLSSSKVCWRLARGLALGVLLISFATAFEYGTGIDLHIDQALFQEPANVLRAPFPGRIAPPATLAFVLLGIALLLVRSAQIQRRRMVDGLVAGILTLSLMTVLGCVFSSRLPGGILFYTQMSLPAALALIFAGGALLTAEPEQGMVYCLVSDGLGSLMLRRLLLFVLILPTVTGLLVELGVRKHWWAEDVDSMIFALAVTLVLLAVVLWNGISLNRLDFLNRDTENVLRRSRDQWEQTFNCMNEGLSYHAPDFTILGANEAFYGLAKEDVRGRKCYEVVHHTSCPPDYCPMRRTLASRRSEAGEFFEPLLQRHLSVRTDPVFDSEGNILRVVHVVQDVSAKRKAEEVTRRLASIVESTDDAILATDLDERITSWNRAAERMYGYTKREIDHQPLKVLCPPEFHDETRIVLQRVRDGGSTVAFETQRIRKDGARIDVAVTVSPLYDADGRVVGKSAIARDITDRKRAERELTELFQREQQARRDLELKQRQIEQLNSELEERVRRRTAELEISNRELEAFSYSVSHDLRAPLRSIDGFSHILLDEFKAELPAEGQDFLTRIRAATQQMGVLIDALLQLSRVTRWEMRRESVDLSLLARSVADTLSNSAPDRRVEFRIAPGLHAEGDARLLQIVMQNLLGNAFKFTSRRDHASVEFGRSTDGNLDVGTAAAPSDGKPVFFVRDNGAGFEMAYAHKLFGAFQRLHAATEFEGSGIGLATVQRIVHRHQGRIWAEGKPGKGAVFYFTLG